ncbi:hypothetical protein [Paraburkholderia sp. 22B1P]|uniref:hypothetical protein n=1 Tax=Paraburkholderia sp. 22B1P TaxID=3080498 RepID=UPI00308D8FD4|nr:hypothetical protein PBP221_17370 [Paraburkholderia sp. 22B1P]
MDFKSFYQGLKKEDRARFAEIAGTSTRYIEIHLMPRRKIPKPPLMAALATACKQLGGSISQDDVLSFFYRTSPAEPKRPA